MMNATELTVSNNWLRVDGAEFMKTADIPPSSIRWEPMASGAPVHVAADGRWARVLDASGAVKTMFRRAVGT